jgi:autotransporter-associated beta strand protein
VETGKALGTLSFSVVPAGTNYFVNDITVGNANSATIGGVNFGFNIAGNLTVRESSYLNWNGSGVFTFKPKTTTVLTIEGGSTNRYDAGASTKSYTMGSLVFGEGSNMLTLSAAQTLTFSDISGGSSNVIDLGSNSGAAVVINAAGACAFDGVIKGSGTVEKKGAGTLALRGENTWSGKMLMSAGTLVVSNQLALQNCTLDLPNIGPVVFVDGIPEFTFGGITSGSQAIGLTNQAGNAITLKVGNNNTDTTYVGLLSGAGNLVKVGSGTFKITGVNSYTGATTIESGTLVFSNRFYLSEYSGAITNNGTLWYQGPSLQNFRGTISGTGTLIHNTPYTLSLYGTNTYSGPTIISNGTLKVINAGSLSTNTALTVVGSGSAVNMNGKTQACVSVGGTGFVTNGTLTVTSALYPGGSNSVGTLTLGNLTLATGSTVHWDYATGAGDTNKVLGIATLPVSATVQVNASGTLPSRAVLFDCGSIVAPGGVGGWTVEGIPQKAQVVLVGNQVHLVVLKGTLISVY